MAHIDAGKTTVTERVLYYTGRTHRLGEVHDGAATMDWMDQEKERGITITSAATTTFWSGNRINIIDTPGHVDFTIEVSRSLAACEGAILLVDSTQGVEAQTVSNIYLALESNLEIIPIVNKIDMKNSNINSTKEQIHELLGTPISEIISISAKTALGIDKVFDAIIEKIPSPNISNSTSFRALIFDSYFDQYRGVIPYIRMVDGYLEKGMKAKYPSTILI
jgi:GTP-binding protein LepA